MAGDKLNRGRTAVIVGAQWGDEGKGKIVDVLSERFVIERLAGSGGMGAVYRALDRITGEAVALW